jgi:hypothetical protein
MTSPTEIQHWTGAQGKIYADDNLIADAEFKFDPTRGSAKHARAGKWSPLDLPGVYELTISAKGVLRDMKFLGGMMNATSTSGQAAVLVAAAPIVPDTVVECTNDPTSPSRIRFAYAKGTGTGITTPGQIIVYGTDPQGAEDTEIIDVGLTTDATKNFDGKKLFATVVNYAVIDLVINGDGTGELRSIAGAAAYTLGDAQRYTIVCKALNTLTGNFVMATVNNAWISKGSFASGADANHVMEEDIVFHVEDLDRDLSVTDLNV